MIIGGGIAGLEAAAQLLKLGYKPVIVEKSDRLGGHVASWYKLFPDMTPAKDVVDRMIESAKGARVLLKTEILFINRLKDLYNVKLTDGSTLQCRSVLIASGFDLFDARKKEEYGYGIYDGVITNSDLENWLSLGEGSPVPVPSDPKAVGFVHCVGSRDVKAGNTQCSKVCCMTAIKQAIEMKEKFPGAEIYCFYMDLRLFGKKYEDFYINAQREYGVHFIRGRVSEVGETVDGRLQVKAEDTLSGKPLKVCLDLLVLMSGMLCNAETAGTAAAIRLEVDSDGFFRSRNNICNITESERPGIFFAGACTGTKTVPETVAEARSAVLNIHNYLRK